MIADIWYEILTYCLPCTLSRKTATTSMVGKYFNQINNLRLICSTTDSIILTMAKIWSQVYIAHDNLEIIDSWVSRSKGNSLTMYVDGLWDTNDICSVMERYRCNIGCIVVMILYDDYHMVDKENPFSTFYSLYGCIHVNTVDNMDRVMSSVHIQKDDSTTTFVLPIGCIDSSTAMYITNVYDSNRLLGNIRTVNVTLVDSEDDEIVIHTSSYDEHDTYARMIYPMRKSGCKSDLMRPWDYVFGALWVNFDLSNIPTDPELLQHTIHNIFCRESSHNPDPWSKLLVTLKNISPTLLRYVEVCMLTHDLSLVLLNNRYIVYDHVYAVEVNSDPESNSEFNSDSE